jgi:hypothetical protein
MAEVRDAYRRLLRLCHPDLVGGVDGAAMAHRQDATTATARLNLAYEIVVALLLSTDEGRVPALAAAVDAEHGAAGDDARAGNSREAEDGTRHDAPRRTGDDEVVRRGVGGDDEDSLFIDAPPDLTWVLLHEAAAKVGNVAYVDPSLGLLEIMVRFDGGPTCSVLMTLQGRAHHTEVMCTMSSIEAAPTPPIAPVVDALVEALTYLG